jgi:predicted alpha/beta superfamily hydrolase
MPLIHRARFLPATAGGIGEGSGSLSAHTMEFFGELRRHANFTSSYVASRNVDVWLPPRYAREDGCRFPVIYMHDGQNLFDPTTAYIGVYWGIDEAI